MRTIPVELPGARYDIVVGYGLLDAEVPRTLLARAVTGRRGLIVTDSTVLPLYADGLAAVLPALGAAAVDTVSFAAGEAHKTLDTVEALYHAGLAAGLDRQSVALALGGGVVGDVAGFFAATYMRGIRLVQVPTTLLALVDSSVGGKVGVDLPEGKNLVGAFFQPVLVLADLACLGSLPAREIRCGLAEIIKYAVILDADLFCLLEENVAALTRLDRALCEDVVSRCCALKTDVVRADEREAGRRAILNYGHTFGHALEAFTGYGRLIHGEAVAIGMGMAADLAVAMGRAAAVLPARQDALLQAYGLPCRAHSVARSAAAAILKLMERDKKASNGKLRLVLPAEIGRVDVLEFTDRDSLETAIGGRLG